MVGRDIHYYCLCHMEAASKTVAGDKPSIEHSLHRATRPSRILSSSVSQEPHQSHHRCRSSCCLSRRDLSVPKTCYSISNRKSYKSPELASSCSRHSIDMRCQGSLSFSKQSVTVIESVNPYYQTTMEFCSYQLPDRSQNYDDDVASLIARMGRPLKV